MYPLSKIVHLEKLKRFRKLDKLFGQIFEAESQIMLFLSVLVGVGAGYASIGFRMLVHTSQHFVFEEVYPWVASYSIYLLPLIPMVGALFLIPFSLKFPGEVNGYGLPKFLILVHLRGGVIRTRNIFLKMITATITIATGGAAGVEGPVATIGGAVGSSIGRFFEIGAQKIKVLIACGSAAAFAAQFNAPIAGVLFALEIIMVGEFALGSFSMIVIASGLATAITQTYFGSAPTFQTEITSYTITSNYELGLYIILGILVGVLSVLFTKVFFGIGDLFQKIPMHAQARPILGALLIGCMGLVFPQVLSDGYEHIKATLVSPSTMALGIMFSLIFLKMIATSITLGSGNVGGVFAPCLYIGAMIGGSFGYVVNFLFPSLKINTASYAIVGMGAFLAASTHAPLTAIFLLFELTSNYQVIVPIMFASVLGTMVAKGLSEDSLDTTELTRMGINLHSGKDENIMEGILTEDVMSKDYEWVSEGMTFSNFLQHLSDTNATEYPVLNHEKRLTGIVSFRAIRDILPEEGLEDLVVMKDVAETKFLKLHSKDNLNIAMGKFASSEMEIIPVVDTKDEHVILGVLMRRDVIIAYNKAVVVREVEDVKKGNS